MVTQWQLIGDGIVVTPESSDVKIVTVVDGTSRTS